MPDPKFTAEFKEKMEKCAEMIVTYNRQGHALFQDQDLPGAKKAFDVAVKVCDSLLATCDVAVRHQVQLEDFGPETLQDVIDITQQFRKNCVEFSETITKLMAADPTRYAVDLPASGIRERES